MRLLGFGKKKPASPLVTFELEALLKIKHECETLIKRSALASAGAAIIPVPFLDMVVDAGILTQILPQISAKFGLGEGRSSVFDAQTGEINWQATKELGLDAAGIVLKRRVIRGTLNNFGTRVITKQITKFIPLGGQIVAASIGYFAMKKIAQAHVDECFEQAIARTQKVKVVS